MDFVGAVIILVIIIFSSILHEISHGIVAERFGDPTARLMGRITLNPLKHIDPFMSVLLPLLLILSGSPIIFGAAKPVPVDPFNLKEGRKDVAIVSLAGPLTNILIAILASILFRIIHGSNETMPVILSSILLLIARLNLLLAIFNLIPIPPLDGSKIFALLLPERQARVYLSIGSVGIFLIYFLLLFPGGGLTSLLENLLKIAQNILGI